MERRGALENGQIQMIDGVSMVGGMYSRRIGKSLDQSIVLFAI